MGGQLQLYGVSGNGITASTTSLSNTYSVSGFPDGNTTYQSAGTYTVLLMMTQVSGTASCAGTATALVTVELPSELVFQMYLLRMVMVQMTFSLYKQRI